MNWLKKFNVQQIWLVEAWEKARPYLIEMSADLMIGSSMWCSLYLFKMMTSALTLGGEASELILIIHSWGVIIAFGLFAGLLIVGLVEIRIGELTEASKQHYPRGHEDDPPKT